MRIEDLKIDEEFKNLLPELTADEYTGLERDILRNGLMCPIATWHGFIVDGHNRYSICKAHRFQEVETREIKCSTRSEVMDWIINNQLSRRNLTKSELVHAYQTFEAELAREAETRMRSGKKDPGSNLPQGSEKERNPRTEDVVAQKIGVSRSTYRDMKLIVKEGTPEQVERMDRGGKGNAVSAIAAEIKSQGVTEKKCKKCGRTLPISEFEKWRNVCKACKCAEVSKWQKRTIRDVKGDIIESTGEYDSVSDEEIIGNLYDIEEEVILTPADVLGELEANASSAVENIRRVFASNAEIVKNNPDSFSKKMDEIVSQILEIRKEYINA